MNLSKSLSSFLSAADIAAPVVISIDRIEEEIIDDLGQEVGMLALYPKGYDQGILLRENHLALLSEILGSKTPTDWIGKKVVMFPDRDVWLYGRPVGAIRFRPAENTNDFQERT